MLWARVWAPWMQPDELAELALRVLAKPLKLTTDVLACRLRLSCDEIGAFDQTSQVRKALRKHRRRVADRLRRGRKGVRPRKEYEASFDGETVEGLTTQWVEREKWPARVKSILLARDRGKCAACGADIVQELRGEGHIDHMFPIARGGCNDLVNLQLLCSKCNLAKSGQAADVTNSVPEYIRRPRKHAGPAKA
jgi:5-methylcytosine-specific restriction endonuclease McrA